MDTDTTDTTGQQDKALDLALKDVLKKRDDLISRLSSSKEKFEDGPAAVIDKAVDAIVKICGRVRLLSSKLGTEEKKIKEHEDNLRDVLTTVKSDVGEQAVVLEQLVQVTGLLESKALGYKGSYEAVVVRRHLDDIRAAVAQGFILVMSDYFIRGDLVNRYDPQERSVIWWKFTDQVGQAWECCYEFQQLFDSNKEGGNEDGGIEYVEDGGSGYVGDRGNEHVDDQEHRDRRFQAIQDKSIFLLLMEDLPYEKLFDAGRCVFTCDGKNRAVLDYGRIEEGSATLARQLRFFAPIFIWKFTETKRDISMLSQQVQDLKDRNSSLLTTLEFMEAGDMVEAFKSIGEQSPPKEPGNEVSNDGGTGDELAFGTAQELRRKPELSAILGALPRFSPPGLGKKAQLKRKPTSDGNAYRGSRPRFEADVSTSIRSYAAEGLEKVHSTYPDEELAQIAQDPPERTSHPQALQSTSATSVWQHTKEGTAQQQREIVSCMRAAEDQLAKAKGKFDTLRKCLHILLSDNVLRLAVTGPSVLRNALNYLAHSRHAYDKDYEESIRDVQQLLERVKKDIADKGNMGLLTAFDELRQDEEGIAHGKELEGAHRVLMESDYFVKDDVTTEKEIDIFIEAQLDSEKIDATNPDYLILLQWMESANPAQMDQEPKTTDSKAKGKAKGKAKTKGKAT